jgi:hypothetical protein
VRNAESGFAGVGRKRVGFGDSKELAQRVLCRGLMTRYLVLARSSSQILKRRACGSEQRVAETRRLKRSRW